MNKIPNFLFLLGLLCLAACIAFLGGCDDSRDDSSGGTAVKESAQIDLDPSPSIVFTAVVGQASQPKQVTISNNGRGELIVKSLSLEEDDPVKEFTISYEIPRDADGRKLVNVDEKQICPNTSNFRLVGYDQEDEDHLSYCLLWIFYEPTDSERDIGRLIVQSNDTGKPRVEILLTSGESVPELSVDPPSVEFSNVMEGDTVTETLSVFNSGKADLEIQRIEMVNDADGQFTVEISQDEGTYHTYPASIKPGATAQDRETMVLLIHYTPTRIGSAEGRLRLETNDPENRTHDVTITASSIKPCIEITPSDADFGDVAIGESKELALDLTNCGNADLLVTEASFIDPGEGTSPDFHILSVPEGLECGEDADSCTGEVVISQLSTRAVVLQYTPAEEGPDGGRLLLRTNVAQKEELEIHLFGRGTTNTCPVAVAEARVAGADTWDEFPDDDHRMETIPLKTLELRGDRSTDPDGSIASYKWTVLERPEDSTAQLAPHEAAANPTFFLDLAGRYVFELQVVDNKGLPSCRNALMVIKAIPDEDIHVQLVWDTPADPDQTDEGFAAGSDMDIHVLHPLGDWFDLPHDCFYGNPNPDWARPANPSDDPSLDRDDTDGAGPENINLDNPENNRVYRVGVHYFNDHGYGASFTTLRVFVQGILRFELANKRMPATDYFWDVASIAWPGGNIQQIDNLMAAAPNGGGQ